MINNDGNIQDGLLCDKLVDRSFLGASFPMLHFGYNTNSWGSITDITIELEFKTITN